MANRFVFDPDFDENVKRASNKTGSSLRQLFDQVRKITDEIAKSAKASIMLEARVAANETLTAKGDYSRSGRQLFLRGKAKEFALRSAANSTVPTMGFDGHEIFGRVIINRTDSASLEFGGIDSKAEIGKGTGQFVDHPAYSFLRRALDRAG